MRLDKLNTIFVLSKERPYCNTAQYLKEIDYPYWYVVIEDNEKYAEEYEENFRNHVLHFTRSDYENFDYHDHYGLSIPTGPVPARNFILNFGKKNNLLRLWELDDDTEGFSFFYKVTKKYRISDGKTLYKLLNIISTLGLNISSEGLSFKDSVFVRYDKNNTEHPKVVKNVIFVNLPCNTKYLFENRGYDDISRACKLLRQGHLIYELTFCLTNTKHEHNGSMEEQRRIMTSDLANVCTLKDNPLVEMFLKTDEITNKPVLRVRHKYSKLAPKLISSDYM